MRTQIAAALAVGALAAVPLGVIAIASNRDSVTGPDADRAARVAVEAAGGGTVLDVDRDSENGATWEVEVVKPDGSRVDVLLDALFRAIDVSAERESNEMRAPDKEPNAADSEQPITGPEADQAAQAALKAAGGGSVLDVDRDSENGATWEVELVKPDGSHVDVLLDAQFRVIDVGGEQEPYEGADDQDDDRD